MNLSQTQISNISTLSGLLVITLNQFGIVWETSQVAFVMGAVWSLGSTAYNYYQRYQKGDLNLLGARK